MVLLMLVLVVLLTGIILQCDYQYMQNKTCVSGKPGLAKRVAGIASHQQSNPKIWNGDRERKGVGGQGENTLEN